MTDETTIITAEVLTEHNEHYWAESKPRFAHLHTFQYQFKLNLWIRVLGEHLFCSVFFPHNLNDSAFLEFLLNMLPFCLGAINIQDIRDRGMLF